MRNTLCVHQKGMISYIEATMLCRYFVHKGITHLYVQIEHNSLIHSYTVLELSYRDA